MKRTSLLITGIILLAACGTTSQAADSLSNTNEADRLSTNASVDVLSDFIVNYREGTNSSGVATVSCAAGEVLLGGGCACTGSVADDEAGILFGCAASGDSTGYVGGCYDWAAGQTANPIHIRVQCGTVKTNSVVQAAPGVPNASVLGEVEKLRLQQEAHRSSLD